MSTFFQKITMKREIKKLNRAIDLKIIKGLPYKAEARRHRFLMSQFYMGKERSRSGMLQRVAHVCASFLL